MKFTLLALASSLLLQSGTLSPQDLVSLERRLTATEMDVVVSGIRQALAGMTLRLVQERASADREVRMGRAGMPQMIRLSGNATSESIGGSIGGVKGGGAGVVSVPPSLTIGERRVAGTRNTRALVMSSGIGPLLTGDPAPDPAEFVPMHSLWIDTGSLLPLRWEVSQHQAIIGAIDFVYEPLEFQRPSGVGVPNCVS